MSESIFGIPALGGEHVAMNGEGSAGAFLAALLLPHEASSWRVLALVLGICGVAVFAHVARRLCGSAVAGGALALVVLAHPYTQAAAWDVRTLPFALSLLAAASACALVLRRGLAARLAGLLLLVAAVISPPGGGAAWVPFWIALASSSLRGRTARLAGGAIAGIAMFLILVPEPGTRLSGLPGALGAVVAPGIAGDAGVPWQRSAAFAVPLALTGLLGWWRRRRGDGTLLLFALLLAVGGGLVLSGAPDPVLENTAAALPEVVGVALLVGLLAARAVTVPASRVVLATAAALLVLSGHTTARLAWRAQAPVRREAGRLVRSLKELPAPAAAPVVDAVLGPTVLGEHLEAAFPERQVLACERLADPGPGHILRLSAWRPPARLFADQRETWTLDTAFMALRVPEHELELLEPADRALQPARRPEDEPVFTWSVDAKTDPGPDAFTFVGVGRPLLQPGPSLLARSLDASVLARKAASGRVVYRWRPSVRSAMAEEREIAWEQEELARRGTTFSWTILVIRDDPTGSRILMAAPRTLRLLP